MEEVDKDEGKPKKNNQALHFPHNCKSTIPNNNTNNRNGNIPRLI